ncbi:SAM-dependent methyltransferase [Actinomadura scrupuli]|uniref:SAM-dependent methyltransferase n=1 Tax=Actinomadura scrupuli TaxID=559629 RepID=UPI003D957CF0
MTDRSSPSSKIDTSRPHSARMWNYWLGGKDYYPIDKRVGDEILETFPAIREVARQSRACLGRMIRYLAAEEGIRQFLDIGTGLPTVGNTHEVAQRVAPTSKIVYVDNDPLVLVHAAALLTSTPEGACGYIDCDVRDPDRILEKAAGILDFTEPIGLIMFGILGNVIDDDEATVIVRRLVGALPPGSFLALNDGTGELDRAGREEAIRIAVEQGSMPYVARNPDQIAGFFDGLDVLEPGVVTTSQWRWESNPFGEPAQVDSTCGLARKP